MNNFTEVFSDKIAFYICQSKDKNSEEFAVLKYGVFVVVQITIAIIVTILFGIITKTIPEILIISIIAGWMKRYSGGAHCSSPNRCLVTGVIVSYIFALIAKNIVNIKFSYIVNLLVLIHTFIILYKKCPIGSKNKPLKKESTRKRLRKKAFFIYFINVALFTINILLDLGNIDTNLNYLVVSINLGIYMQILTLTHVGNEFIVKLDGFLKKLKI